MKNNTLKNKKKIKNIYNKDYENKEEYIYT